MASFPGGSAWSMARDISSGTQLVTEVTFKRFRRPELEVLGFELDRLLREIRSEATPTGDVTATQQRNRRLQRLSSARMMLTHHLAGKKPGAV